MKKNLNQILLIIRELTPTLQKKYSISTIEIFGSYITKAQKQNSDLDLMVTFSKTPTLIKFIELENFLSDRIGIKVDLVMKDSIRPRLRSSILSNAILV
ncbi:MAG: nucleotidyltransferase family protein [Melioribacteraceae bacterium]